MPNFLPTGVTEEQLSKAADVGRSVPSEPEEYTGPTYVTEFVNNRSKEVPVWESKFAILRVPAKGKSVLISWSNGTTYAPFRQITFEKDGRTSVSWRPHFPDPLANAPYTILLDNQDGANSETLKIGDNFVEVLKGIPKRVAVDIDSAQVVFKKIVWKKRVVKIPIEGNKNYLETRTIIERRMVQRKKSEIAAITKYLRDQALKAAQKEVERRFPGIEGGPEMDDGDEVSGLNIEG